MPEGLSTAIIQSSSRRTVSCEGSTGAGRAARLAAGRAGAPRFPGCVTTSSRASGWSAEARFPFTRTFLVRIILKRWLTGTRRQPLAQDFVEPNPGMVAVDAKLDHLGRGDGTTPLNCRVYAEGHDHRRPPQERLHRVEQTAQERQGRHRPHRGDVREPFLRQRRPLRAGAGRLGVGPLRPLQGHFPGVGPLRRLFPRGPPPGLRLPGRQPRRRHVRAAEAVALRLRRARMGLEALEFEEVDMDRVVGLDGEEAPPPPPPPAQGITSFTREQRQANELSLSGADEMPPFSPQDPPGTLLFRGLKRLGASLAVGAGHARAAPAAADPARPPGPGSSRSCARR